MIVINSWSWVVNKIELKLIKLLVQRHVGIYLMYLRYSGSHYLSTLYKEVRQMC